jgi:hypothetical protein
MTLSFDKSVYSSFKMISVLEEYSSIKASDLIELKTLIISNLGISQNEKS